MKTYQPTQKDIKRNWHLVDGSGQILGRLATEVARFLIGKHKRNYSQHMDSGDYVVVLNPNKIELTGRKEKQKEYISHSGYPGGFKKVAFAKLIKENPAKVIEHAVSGMLPDNKLKNKRLTRLKIVIGDKNPYEEKFRNKDQNLKT